MSVERKSKKRPQSKRGGSSKFNPNYFALPHPIWMIVIPFGILLLVVSTFQPDSLPDFLGPLGSFAKLMGTQYNNICVLLCVFCAVAHSAEAAYAGKICHDRGMTTSATIKWVASTFIFGFASLLLRLVPYKPDYKIV
ncbi:transmembrane protein c10orf57-like protein [Plakobranchus ocellatus]|uniref:Transmembrane protein 254 n=1 Tax=Plakobranchus ocellatus TaxID=259542 RepID=A0AAV4E0Q9_9GAST|nr:transmembrane protein c10orf57-like protein [Plakobranchus ocellatus]